MADLPLHEDSIDEEPVVEVIDQRPGFFGRLFGGGQKRSWIGNAPAKQDKVRHMARMLRNKHKDYANKDGEMSDAEQRKFVDEYREEIVGAEGLAMWKRGASNAGYHYLMW